MFSFTVIHIFAILQIATQAYANKPRKVVVGVDGGTESIRACCFDAVDGRVIGTSCAVPYKTFHPQPGWAEQNPQDWYQNLGSAVRGAVKSLKGLKEDVDICAICVDTTCCSVVALDEKNEPLRPSLLWMDARSAAQTKEILDVAKGDSALAVNCDGEGPISAEWMSPKALWIKQNEPEIWKNAKTICEYQDFINVKLTGNMCASSCNAAARWHWDGEECIENDDNNPYKGRPMALYQKLGMLELADKLPSKCLPMGSLVGKLTKEAAEHLNLEEGTPVAQGGPDAFVGMIGLGCIHPKQLCLITGSSHLHCVVTSAPSTAPGTWGAYRGAPLPGTNFAEGGQSSTGSIIRWAKSLFGNDLGYKELDDEAAAIDPGSDGLLALETFQGSRTPVTDPLARGALIGITLSHTRGHIWRALMEAVCYGTRGCIDGLASAGHDCSEIIIAGGTTRSAVWLQMHADVTGKPVVLCENIDAPLLGCAILASVGAGVHSSVEDAVKMMVRVARRVEPHSETVQKYDSLYQNAYKDLSPSVRPIVHSLAGLRGGSSNSGKRNNDQTDSSGKVITISPSLLASDWANISLEIKRCLDANLTQLHVDVFDGVFLDSPNALTFGPQMVRAMRSVSNEMSLDIHLCVDRPARYVDAMSTAGATQLIFQWEAMKNLQEAKVLSKAIKDKGMRCGISLNPETDIEDVFPLLESGLIDTVDILAVEPGFGGQVFQEASLEKISTLRHLLTSSKKLNVSIMVDGGINEHTSKLATNAGADILVAGTFLFQHERMIEGASKLQ